MFGYDVLASCACACLTVPRTATKAKLLMAIVLRVFRFIEFSRDSRFFQ
jgi:hypothetical protein